MLTELECKRALHDVIYKKLTAAMHGFDEIKTAYESTVADGERRRGEATCGAHILPLGFEREQEQKESALKRHSEIHGREVKVWNEVFKFLLDNIVGREFNFKANPVPSD